MQERRPHSLILTLAACLAATGLASSCASSGTKAPAASSVENLGPDGPEPYDPDLMADRRAPGIVLADFGRKIKTWTSLRNEGDRSKDGRVLMNIEGSLRHEARSKADLLIQQLQSSPAKVNRQRAAVALGFSDSPDALAPLLVALDDEEPDVVANALLGLAILGEPSTPVKRIAAFFSDRSQPLEVRNNAGQALNSLRGSVVGASSDVVVEAARSALTDPEAPVRVHGIILLARAGDTASIGAIASMLDDEYPLVVRAASRALARLGDVEPRVFGTAARALIGGWKRIDNRGLKSAVMRDLQVLSRRNYDDYDDWVQWAADLN